MHATAAGNRRQFYGALTVVRWMFAARLQCCSEAHSELRKLLCVCFVLRQAGDDRLPAVMAGSGSPSAYAHRRRTLLRCYSAILLFCYSASELLAFVRLHCCVTNSKVLQNSTIASFDAWMRAPRE